ncbi:zinc ribbon domain-containing protein [Chloroflexota bacterium]|nr:zinc ribbon domain-containing protein [Chloroflexota bacterium]
MARKSLGFVPLIWDCPSCGTQNPGPIKSCTACGAPQPEDVKFLRVDEEQFNFIKDEALIRMAKAGPDIHCPWCGTRNPGTATLCSNCGGELGQGGKLRATGGKVQTASEAKAEAEKPQPVPASRPSTASGFKQPAKPMNKKGIIIAVVVIAVLCLAGILILSWLNKTDATTATVSDLYWERSIQVESYQEVIDSDWCDELPSDAVVTATSQNYRYISEDPVVNATEVCGDEYVVDTGTGVGEVVQDCVYEVYDEYCEYQAWAWVALDPVTISGRDLVPYWPSVSLDDGVREAGNSEDYAITFRADGEEYTYYTDDVDLFLQAELGSTWTISVNQMGNVRSAEPYN